MKKEVPEEIKGRIRAMARNDPDEAESIAIALVYELGYVPAHLVHLFYLMQDDDSDLKKRIGGLEIRQMPGVGEVR